MAGRKRRLVAADGLTVTEVVSLRDETAAMLPYDLFADIDQEWRTRAPRPHARVAHQSPAWYAREILKWLTRLRGGVASQNADTAAYAALKVGWLHGTAFFRFNLGDHARLGVRVQAKNRAAARRRRERAHSISDDQLANSVDRVHQKYPASHNRSARWLAERVAMELGCSKHTIRRRLATLERR